MPAGRAQIGKDIKAGHAGADSPSMVEAWPPRPRLLDRHRHNRGANVPAARPARNQQKTGAPAAAVGSAGVGALIIIAARPVRWRRTADPVTDTDEAPAESPTPTTGGVRVLSRRQPPTCARRTRAQRIADAIERGNLVAAATGPKPSTCPTTAAPTGSSIGAVTSNATCEPPSMTTAIAWTSNSATPKPC